MGSTVLLPTRAAGVVPTLPIEPGSLAGAMDTAARRAAGEAALHECFGAAYSVIAAPVGCGHLEEGGKRRLAFAVAACHLSYAGRGVDVPACAPYHHQTAPAESAAAEPGDGLPICLAALSPEAFATFTAYTTHVDNLCWYYESRAFRAGVTEVVGRLVGSANDTAVALRAVAVSSRDLTRLNAEAQADTRAALNRSVALAGQLEASHASLAVGQAQLAAGMADARASHAVVSDALRQVAAYSAAALRLQGYVVSHLLLLQTAAFYAATGAAVWAVSATRRTADLRAPLTLLLLAAAALEMAVAWYWDDVGAAAAATAPPLEAGLPALVDAGGVAALPSPLTPSSSFLAGTAQWFVRQCAGVAVGAARWLHDGSSAVVRGTLHKLHADAWEAAGVSAVIRYAYLVAAAAALLRHLATYVDYQQANHALLQRLLAAMASGGGDSAACNDTACNDVAPSSLSLSALFDTLLPGRGPSGAGSKKDNDGYNDDDDELDDPDYAPSLPPSRRAPAVSLPTLAARIAATAPAVPPAIPTFHVDGGGGGAPPAPLLPPTHAGRYALRPRAAGLAAARNPLVEVESPAAFAELVHLRAVASTLHRYLAVTALATNVDADTGADYRYADVDGDADGGSYIISDVDNDGEDTAAWEDVSDTDSEGGGSEAGVDIIDNGTAADHPAVDNGAGTGLFLHAPPAWPVATLFAHDDDGGAADIVAQPPPLSLPPLPQPLPPPTTTTTSLQHVAATPQTSGVKRKAADHEGDDADGSSNADDPMEDVVDAADDQPAAMADIFLDATVAAAALPAAVRKGGAKRSRHA